jgi:hypothetical protein
MLTETCAAALLAAMKRPAVIIKCEYIIFSIDLDLF